ncbi:hypothetical protein TNCV_4107981 [Trichonephila clavipes]|nr:hypothetical protein TNCV_4107981 [Trichonephila clavipes]
MNGGSEQWIGTTLCLLKNPVSACNVVMVGFEFEDTVIELLPCPAYSPDLSPIEKVKSMLAQLLTRDSPSTTTPDQLW